jgi:hypothetical protein
MQNNEPRAISSDVWINYKRVGLGEKADKAIRLRIQPKIEATGSFLSISFHFVGVPKFNIVLVLEQSTNSNTGLTGTKENPRATTVQHRDIRKSF